MEDRHAGRLEHPRGLGQRPERAHIAVHQPVQQRMGYPAEQPPDEHRAHPGIAARHRGAGHGPPSRQYPERGADPEPDQTRAPDRMEPEVDRIPAAQDEVARLEIDRHPTRHKAVSETHRGAAPFRSRPGPKWNGVNGITAPSTPVAPTRLSA